MYTTRNRFGVSILVGLTVAVLCSLNTPALAAQASVAPAGVEGAAVFSIEGVMAAASSRAQLAIGLGAGVPLIVIGFMVRRRNLAES